MLNSYKLVTVINIKYNIEDLNPGFKLLSGSDGLIENWSEVYVCDKERNKEMDNDE